MRSDELSGDLNDLSLGDPIGVVSSYRGGSMTYIGRYDGDSLDGVRVLRLRLGKGDSSQLFIFYFEDEPSAKANPFVKDPRIIREVFTIPLFRS